MCFNTTRFSSLDPSSGYYSQFSSTDTKLLELVSVRNMDVEIRDVWNFNLEEEFQNIHWALQHGYRVVALDTEFPGAPYVPTGVSLNYRDRNSDDHYAVIKMNVDRLKIIQIGITLTDNNGNMPHFETGKRVAWQFNFSDFDADKDECNTESVSLLKEHGINFWRHKVFGIESARFAYFMTRSGLVGPLGCPKAWITFQGGMDIAYLLKMIFVKGLPDDLKRFKKCIRRFFGCCIFDIKHMITRCGLYGGLAKVASVLNVEREAGESHTAGSDSLLTSMLFQKLQNLYFDQPEKLFKVVGKIHNL